MKKVLFVITKSNWGGAQRYVYDLATNIPKEYEAVVALGGNGPLVQKLVAAGIRTIPLDSLERDISILKDIRSFLKLVSLFWSESPTIVHLNSSKAGGMGALAARICGVPRIVFTAHGWFHNEKRSVVARVLAWILHLVTQVLVHTTIAVSHAAYRTAPLKKSVRVIHNAVHITEPLQRADARKLLSEKGASFGSEIAIGTIGELHANKGHDVLIESAKLLPESSSIIIIGGGEKRKNIEQQINSEHLTSRVFLTGHIDTASQYLSAFDIFVLPSRTEALAYVVLEAGLAGLPVVASSVGGVPEIVENGVTGLLVPAENAKALAEALQKLIDAPELREQYGKALKEKVVREFSLERMVSETVAVYKN